MHWNNLAGPVRIELTDGKDVKLPEEASQAPKVDAKADIDPRRFLVDLRTIDANTKSGFTVKVSYHVCDNAQTVCLDVEQEYKVFLNYDRNGGSRAGVFMIPMVSGRGPVGHQR